MSPFWVTILCFTGCLSCESSPIIREEDPVSPALAGPREQLLRQVQSWLVCVFWEDDMAIPAASIRHAAYQLGLQLPAHALHSCRQAHHFSFFHQIVFATCMRVNQPQKIHQALSSLTGMFLILTEGGRKCIKHSSSLYTVVRYTVGNANMYNIIVD